MSIVAPIAPSNGCVEPSIPEASPWKDCDDSSLSHWASPCLCDAALELGLGPGPQFEGSLRHGVQYNFGRQPYQPMPIEPELLPADRGPFYDYDRCSIWNWRMWRAV